MLGGLVSGRAELVRRIHHSREIAGASLHAHAAYAILRGMKTLALRMARHNANAQAIAEHLAGHAKVERELYPGLPIHPGYEIARRQMRGSAVCFRSCREADLEAVRAVLDPLELLSVLPISADRTAAKPPQVTSHVELTPEERARAGIPENMIRYSAGIEDASDLMVDLDRALAPL